MTQIKTEGSFLSVLTIKSIKNAYNADWDMEMPFFKKTFQLVLKIFNSELVGNLG